MADSSRVFRWVEDHQEEMVQFCLEFMRRKSVIGQERESQEWLRTRLEGFGFDKVDCWAEDEGGLRPNVVAVKAGSGGRGLIFNGHGDVVPVEDFEKERWTVDPWNPTVKDGKIWGRGANDMKGPNTTALFAARALIETGTRLGGDLILEFVVGEERMEHELGTTATVRRGYRAPFAVVVEPTNCEIHPVTTGAFGWELAVAGKPTHTCLKNQVIFPQRYGLPVGESVGVDAFVKSLRILQGWEHLEREWNLRWRHPALGGGGFPRPDVQGVGCFSITATLVDAGDYIAAVPGRSNIQGNTYYPAWVSLAEVVADMQRVIDGVAACDDWLKKNPPGFRVMYHWPPSHVDLAHEGCQTLAESWRQATGEEPVFSGFKAVCDSTFLCEQGIPAVIFGPGDLSMGAHGPDEHVPIDQMVTACKTLAQLAINWCGLK
ncbi:MAG: M20/M25/M40 family metallo-hydrolase [bacterium]|nr:M20/M25/M40 family metallo-hydrolase [bacterium]